MDGFYDDFLKTSGNENILMCVVEYTFKHEIYDIFNLWSIIIDFYFCQFVTDIFKLWYKLYCVSKKRHKEIGSGKLDCVFFC